MCLEPNFLGVAPGGSRCKHFAMLKRGFKEALDTTMRQASMEMSHWAATNLHWNFRDSLVCSAVGSGSRLCSQSFSCSAISTLLQRWARGMLLYKRWDVGFAPSLSSSICAILGGQRCSQSWPDICHSWDVCTKCLVTASCYPYSKIKRNAIFSILWKMGCSAVLFSGLQRSTNC